MDALLVARRADAPALDPRWERSRGLDRPRRACARYRPYVPAPAPAPSISPAERAPSPPPLAMPRAVRRADEDAVAALLEL